MFVPVGGDGQDATAVERGESATALLGRPRRAVIEPV